MSTLIECGRREKHTQHWVVQPPEGGLGGVLCSGEASGPTEMEIELIEGIKALRNGITKEIR